MSNPVSRACIVLLLYVIGPGPARAQEPPLTPGSVALLAARLDGPALETVGRGIVSESPMIRAISARLAGVAAYEPHAAAIAAAFEREQDPIAAVEQARALLFIRGAAAADSIEVRMKASPPVAAAYAEWVAAAQPERLALLLPALSASIGGDLVELSAIVRGVVERLPDGGVPLMRAWMQSATPMAWGDFMDHIPLDPVAAGRQAVVIEALSAKGSGIREATIWSVVGRLLRERPLPEAVLDAVVVPLRSPGTAADPVPVTWEQYGREAVARRHAKRKTPDRSALVKGERPGPHIDLRVLALLDETTGPERKALRDVLGEAYPERQRFMLSEWFGGRGGPGMRTFPALWPGFLPGVLEAADCTVRNGSAYGAVSVTYGRDGRAATAAMNANALPEGCSTAVAALARLTLADPSYSKAGESEMLVLPLDADYIACALDPKAGKTSSERKVRPKRTHYVQPAYPFLMQMNRIQGVAMLDSTVTSTGCVTNIRVVRSIQPALDYAAVRAVSGWRFQPATIEGRETAISMILSVNFTLR